MIRGVVAQFKARISLRVVGGADHALTIAAAVDTDFNGMLTLPPDIITALELQWKSEGCGVLPDGRLSYFNVYEAKVHWHGRVHSITVNELDMYPAVGMGPAGRKRTKRQSATRWPGHDQAIATKSLGSPFHPRSRSHGAGPHAEVHAEMRDALNRPLPLSMGSVIDGVLR